MAAIGAPAFLQSARLRLRTFFDKGEEDQKYRGSVDIFDMVSDAYRVLTDNSSLEDVDLDSIVGEVYQRFIDEFREERNTTQK